jgi:hypothetical protein
MRSANHKKISADTSDEARVFARFSNGHRPRSGDAIVWSADGV